MGNKQSKQKQWKEIPIDNDIKAYEIIAVNDKEILMAFNENNLGSVHKGKIQGAIYIYNIYSRHLTLFSKYPEVYHNPDETKMLLGPTYDGYSNKIYLIATIFTENNTDSWATYLDHKLLTFDMNTKQITQQDIQLSSESQFRMFHTKEKLHLLLLGFNKHNVYDKNTQKMESNNQINLDCMDSSCRHLSVCVPSQNRILTVSQDINRVIRIYAFDLLTKKWVLITKCNDKLLDLLCFYQVMLTMNEKHIILLSCWEVIDNGITIMDTAGKNAYKLRKSKICLPSFDANIHNIHVVIAGGDKYQNELLIYGYMRRKCRKCKLGMIAYDVMMVVASYHVNEYLHCFFIVHTGQNGINRHCRIPMWAVLH